MCDCHDQASLLARRTVLQGALGAAAAVGLGALGAPSALAAAPPATGAATDVTGTGAAVLAPADALAGLQLLAGDAHVHDDHSSDGSFLRQTAGQGSPGNLSVGDQIGEAERTGLAWLPLTDHRTFSQHYNPQWTSSTMLLVTGEEANGGPHAVVLGAVDEIVDGSNPPGPPHRHVQQSVWDAHAQAAAWGTAHPNDTQSPDDTNRNVVGVDWIEVWNKASDPDEEVRYAERRWTEGLRSGVTGACDCHFREVWPIAGPGMPTTWVLAASRTERAILDALRAGRTTIGPNPLGPLVTLEADLDGDGVYEGVGGDELSVLAGAAGRLRVRVRNAPGTTLTIWPAPGRSGGATPTATAAVTLVDQTFTVPVTVPEGQRWWRVELRGPGSISGIGANPNPQDQLQGVTAPVFTTTGAAAVMRPASPLPAALAPADADDAAAPLVLSGVGSFTGFPDLAVAGAVTHVVAERHVPGRTTVVHRRLPGGSLTTLSGSGQARHPRVAAAGADVWVVFSEDATAQLPHRPDIVLRHSGDGGRSWDAPQRLTAVAPGVRAERPAVLITPAGPPLVAWQENTGAAAFEVRARVVGVDAAPVAVSAPGKVVTPGTPADTRSARYPASVLPDLTVLPDGSLVVLWQDDRADPDPLFTGRTDPNGKPADSTDPDAWEPLLAVRAPGGSWSTPRRVRPDARQAQRHPAVVARADGVLVCAWDAKPTTSSSGADLALRWSVSRDAGQTWTPEQALDPSPVGMAQRPRLALDPDGAVRAVWYDSRAADWRWRVRTARLADDASGWVGARDVSTAGNATFPAVDAGRVAFTTDRGAAPQRDLTQQIALADVAVAGPAAVVPEVPAAILLPVAGAVAAAAVVARNRSGLPWTG